MPPISVLIKPASAKCNLNCEYCFYKDIAYNRKVADYGFMDAETLREIVKKVLEFADDTATFSFQGGEPTLCGLEFYKDLLKYQELYNKKKVRINNCMQTNGLLLDDEWAGFLHGHNFLVGLSLDGPQKLHDKYRADARGMGTYQAVIQKARLLEKFKVDFNILFVVTSALAESPGKAYTFFRKNRFDFLQFIPCLDPLASKRGKNDFSLLPRDYTLFLKKFFDRWSEDILAGRDVSVRYFNNLVLMVMGGEPDACSMNGFCSCQFVFESDGSCYPCDFYVTDEWRLGNIRDMGIMELYKSENNRRFLKTGAVEAEECKSCKWRRLCRGGCRRDREDALKNELTSNYYCRSYYEFLEYAYPKLTEITRFICAVR